VRVLFVVNNSLGWKTMARHIEEQAASRPDMRFAFHRIEATFVQKVLTRTLPGLRRGLTSQTDLWSRHVKRHLGRDLRDGAFDVVVCMGQGIAYAVLQCVNTARTAVAVLLDTTGASFARDLAKDTTFDVNKATEEQAVYDQCALMLPLSSWAGHSLRSDYGVDSLRILVCPPSAKYIGLKSGKKTNSPASVVFVGNDFNRKGGHDLVRWHQSRLSQICRLHIISAKAPKGLSGANLVVHGLMDNHRLIHEVLPEADIFCLPTRHDMSPHALAEAQLSGLPCVSSDLAGIPELVVHNQTGLLVKPGNDEGFIEAISRLSTDADLRLSMAHSASERSREVLNSALTYPRLFDRLRLIGC
jgi:glycosyl transferase family 1